jgi:hypothetical protein
MDILNELIELSKTWDLDGTIKARKKLNGLISKIEHYQKGLKKD